jgi:hypothetical protein
MPELVECKADDQVLSGYLANERIARTRSCQPMTKKMPARSKGSKQTSQKDNCLNADKLLPLRVCPAEEVHHYKGLSCQQHQQLNGKVRIPIVNRAMWYGKKQRENRNWPTTGPIR